MRCLRLLVTTAIVCLLPLWLAPIASNSAQAAGTGCLPGTLKHRLNQIRKTFGAVRVISSFRRGARIAGSGKRSLHASCRAVDFHPPRGKYAKVVAWLKRNHKGGVGTYSCGMHHVHIDNGPHVRFHHCVTASGRPRKHAGKRRSKRRIAARQPSRVKRKVTRRSKQATVRRLPIRRKAVTVKTKVVSAPAQNFKALGYFSRGKINGS